MKYEIILIPNYGNEKIIIDKVKSLGIKTNGKTRPSGFRGCDVPVILDIECEPETEKKLKFILEEVSTDTFSIFERCPTCGRGESL